jgi:hypothetical protein
MGRKMRKFVFVFFLCVYSAIHPARAVVIDPNLSVGSVPSTAGTGLNGSYYKFATGYLTSLAMANQLIAAATGPTATFTTSAVCFPNCSNGVTAASATLESFLNGNIDNFAYTVPPWQIPANTDHSALVLSGYIAITQAGTYNFNLGSDDGSLLTIGNQVVVDDSGLHAFQIVSGSATFAAAGLYAINIQYFENNGYTGLELWATNSAGSCIIGRNGNCIGTAATNLFYTTPMTAIPEASTLAVFATGLIGLTLVRRRQYGAI